MSVPSIQSKGLQPDYDVGDIIVRKHENRLDRCAVMIGWDSWLRPMVFCVDRAAGEPQFRTMSLEEFEAGLGSDLLRHVCAGDLAAPAPDLPATNVIWGRIRSFLKAYPPSRSCGWNCEQIARYLVAGGEVLEAGHSYRAIDIAA